MRKILALLFVALLAFPILPVFAAPNRVAPLPKDPPDNLVPSSAVQKTSFVPHFTGNGPVTDKGKITYLTTLNGFTWNKTKSQSLTLGIPSLVMATSVASLTVPSIYSNSTTTQYRFSGFANSMSSSNYFIAVSFTPQGYSTKVSIDGSVGTATVLRLPFTAINATIVQSSSMLRGSITKTLLPQIRAGNQVFDWSDVPSTFNPTWNSVSNTLSITLNGVFHIDPIALDGSASGGCASPCSSYTMTLSTTSSPDVIIVYGGGNCGGANPTTNSVTDGSSLTWNKRSHLFVTGFAGWVDEFAANASSTLSSDVVTFHLGGCANANMAGWAFGASGANTASSSFDSNVALPATGKCSGGGCGPTVDTVTGVSTSNANDMIIAGDFNGNGGGAFAAGSPSMTFIGSQNTGGGGETSSEYKVVSATQSSITVTFTGADSDGFSYGMIVDAIKSGTVTVSQGIKITTANSAPSATISISGCAVSNGTFTANGNVKHYTGMTASCTVTLTEPTDGSNTRYRFNKSPHPTIATSITFQTCGSGTCSEYDNTTYYQLKNTYFEVCQAPNNCDGQYMGRSNGVTPAISYNTLSGYWIGTLLNGKPDICTVQGTNIQMQMQQALTGDAGRCFDTNTLSAAAAIWADYNMVVTLPALMGNTWNAQGNHSFSDTTGGNTHRVNYVQATASAIVTQPTWLWMLFFPGLILGVVVARRRRR